MNQRDCWGNLLTLIVDLADWEDGRPLNNRLIGIWMPGSFIDQRERSNEELKSKGRIERERQWHKGKRSSVLQNISKGKACPWKGCVNLSPINRWVGTKVNKGTLQPSSYLITLKKKKKKGGGTKSSRQAIKYDYNSKNKEKQVKETVSNIDSELASSLQHQGDSAW